ncbi:FecR family protein [Pseudomonas aeruginosa]|uniref:FecR family protein n=1 Tax=Pseudomonas aeruginosa TaxID=287 RepID=UPI0029530FEE|nr:FecR domain-containing protein [Pseudomonas aeruginosa]MDV7958847.1 FecR domain-containing protein [Pseudomonas aeruginosa]
MTALALTSRSLFPACAALALGGLLTLLAGSVAAAPAKTKRPPFIEQGETCLPQPLPASVLYLAGDAWKLDAKGNQTPLEEGMDIDELEGVKTSPTAFVSLLLGDGSRIVLRAGQVESYVLKRKSDHDRFQVLTPVGVLGVRGTHFRARTEDGQALTEVLDGRVAVNRELTSDDLPLNGRRPARKAAQAEPDEDVLVDARRGLKVKPQGKLTPVDLLPAPQLRGQGGEHGESPVWKLYLAPLHGAKRYRAQVASDPDFLRIQQERFSSTPEVSFSGLKAAFYHVRLSAFDNDGLEGETSVYDILYYPRGGSAR